MICREKMKINHVKIKCTNRHNYAATIPGEAGFGRVIQLVIKLAMHRLSETNAKGFVFKTS